MPPQLLFHDTDRFQSTAFFCVMDISLEKQLWLFPIAKATPPARKISLKKHSNLYYSVCQKTI